MLHEGRKEEATQTRYSGRKVGTKEIGGDPVDPSQVQEGSVGRACWGGVRSFFFFFWQVHVGPTTMLLCHPTCNQVAVRDFCAALPNVHFSEGFRRRT